MVDAGGRRCIKHVRMVAQNVPSIAVARDEEKSGDALEGPLRLDPWSWSAIRFWMPAGRFSSAFRAFRAMAATGSPMVESPRSAMRPTYPGAPVTIRSAMAEFAVLVLAWTATASRAGQYHHVVLGENLG